MKRRRIVGSLVGVAFASGAVVAEAERNYAAVASRAETEAQVEAVDVGKDGLRVRLLVRNSLNEPVRLRYVHLDVDHAEYVDSASVPFNEYRSLDPGRSPLIVTIPERQLTGEPTAGETVTVSGTVAVTVYNEYEFDIPVGPTEARL